MLSYFPIDIYDSHQARKIKEIYNYFIAIILITIISQHYLNISSSKKARKPNYTGANMSSSLMQTNLCEVFILYLVLLIRSNHLPLLI